MEPAERLTGFLTIAARDDRLLTSHVYLYLALCSVWMDGGSAEPFSISRRKIMLACKIQGNGTYHKCIRELHAFGYIFYLPSYHPILGSLVRFPPFTEILNT